MNDTTVDRIFPTLVSAVGRQQSTGRREYDEKCYAALKKRRSSCATRSGLPPGFLCLSTFQAAA